MNTNRLQLAGSVGFQCSVAATIPIGLANLKLEPSHNGTPAILMRPHKNRVV